MSDYQADRLCNQCGSALAAEKAAREKAEVALADIVKRHFVIPPSGDLAERITAAFERVSEELRAEVSAHGAHHAAESGYRCDLLDRLATAERERDEAMAALRAR